MREDPYEVLGVASTADRDAIKAAFRKLAKRYHPDAAGPVLDTSAFHRIRSAYEMLADPERRRAVDRARAGAPVAGKRVRLKHGEVQDVFDDIVDFLRDTVNVSHPSERTFTLKLDTETARRGGKVAIDLPLVSTCAACNGTGGWRRDCERCRGVGYFSETREVTVNVPAGVRTGDTIAVPVAGAAFTARAKIA